MRHVVSIVFYRVFGCLAGSGSCLLGLLRILKSVVSIVFSRVFWLSGRIRPMPFGAAQDPQIRRFYRALPCFMAVWPYPAHAQINRFYRVLSCFSGV